ncbi:3-hydroxyisobutyryl-CoA hydrolase [Tilletia horrida]|uniref:3-hydroxyisobutyryl-CoA hydrolase n=1 Tax=Tilletia horrida TaxID=155126 RepID=A0AAN6GQ60_9BASI|nr:3-hydroxyisobutyryl-CoA hydrolase [Tilletia horrida]
MPASTPAITTAAAAAARRIIVPAAFPLRASSSAASASSSSAASGYSSHRNWSSSSSPLPPRRSRTAMVKLNSPTSTSNSRLSQVNRHLSSSSTITMSSTNNSPSSSRSAPAPDQETVQLLSSGPVRTLRLNRPKALNALNLQMVNSLIQKLDGLAPSPSSSSSSASQSIGSQAPIILLRGEGRALCSGGDVLAVVNAAVSDDPQQRQQSLDFFQAEYELDHRIASLARATGKIFISFMDGITMGGGVGLSLHAPFRIATERTMFAMPETGIGFFPDVGVTRVLARLDGPGASVGNYLGLTGARIGGEEAYLAGLATHFVPSSSIDALVHRLESLSPEAAADIGAVDAALSEFATNPLAETYTSSSTGPSAQWAHKSALLGARRVALDWAFGSAQNDAKAVVTALEDLAANRASDSALFKALEKAGFGGSGSGSSKELPSEIVSWAQETLKALRTKSPRSVVISHLAIKTHLEALKAAQSLIKKNSSASHTQVLEEHQTARYALLSNAFKLDMALATRFCDLALGRDFYEGVTFTLTKDPATGKRREGIAKWADARIEDVDVSEVLERFFKFLNAGSFVHAGSPEFKVPSLNLAGGKFGLEGTPTGSRYWAPSFNVFALPSEAELVALCEGTHPAAGSVAIVDPEEIVSVLSSWRAGKRPLHLVTKAAPEGTKGAGDGSKVGMLEKVKEWAARTL